MPKGSPELTNARREEIVNACETLYQTMGFREITIKEIADYTSFSRPSIYNYVTSFSDKCSLLFNGIIFIPYWAPVPKTGMSIIPSPVQMAEWARLERASAFLRHLLTGGIQGFFMELLGGFELPTSSLPTWPGVSQMVPIRVILHYLV